RFSAKTTHGFGAPSARSFSVTMQTIAGDTSVTSTSRPAQMRKSASSPVPPPTSMSRAPGGKTEMSAARTARRCAATLNHQLYRPSNRSAIASNAAAAGGSVNCDNDASGISRHRCDERLRRTVCTLFAREDRPSVVGGRRARFVVERVAQPTVKGGRIRALKQHRKVVAVRPVRVETELITNSIVKLCTRQWIRHRDAHVVRALLPHEIARRQHVVPRLARIAELQEPARADAARAQG